MQWPWQIHYIDYNDDLPQIYSSDVPNNNYFTSHAPLLSILKKQNSEKFIRSKGDIVVSRKSSVVLNLIHIDLFV